MEIQWKEKHLIQLVAAVMRVERKQKEFSSNEEMVVESEASLDDDKWDRVAEKMPFAVFYALLQNSDNPNVTIFYRHFPGICKRKFAEICGYFNRRFMYFDRNVCLTKRLMDKLAEYSKGFPDTEYFTETGPQAKFIKIDRDFDRGTRSAGLDPDQLETVTRESSCEHLHVQLDIRPDNPETSTLPDDSQLPVEELARNQLRSQKTNRKVKENEFVKKMTHSHVVKGFLLGLPADFCTAHLSEFEQLKRVPFVLIDQDMVKWSPVFYLPLKRALSAGWGHFAKNHNLQVDDIVSFRLIKPRTFQVTTVK